MVLKPVKIQGKRAERREKQRQENPARALKMREARKANLLMVSPLFKEEECVACHIGCSGWYYRDWKNIFYPDTIATSEWFSHYANTFDTVELNAPFYSWPTIATVKSWLRQAQGRPFIYTVKVSELITHTKQFTGTKELIRDFGYIADMLGPQMGCFLYQLPPSFHYSPVRLKRIVSQLDTSRRNVVEFRHKSWWNETVYRAFQEKGIIFCSCSAPKLPQELIKTADDIYLRFHGTLRWYRHNYSNEEIALWAEHIRASEAKRIWVYFNNDYEGYAISNAKELIRQLNA